MRKTRSALGYLVPRRWLRGVVLLVLFLAITGTMVLLQEVAIFYIWATNTKHSTEQLEAMIPQEFNMKARFGIAHTGKPTLGQSAVPVPTITTAQCVIANPRVMFFIRMPKCASTSFTSLLSDLATPLAFQLHFDPSGAYDWSNETVRKEVQLIKSKSRTGKVLYARHFYYIDFRHYGLTDFSYVTVLREPTARFISSYLYYHFSSKPYIQRMLKPQYRHETLLECISRQHNGCAHNWLTKYFCGHRTVCHDGNKTALAIAKDNMKHGFAAVGLLEDVDLTLKVFAKVVPGFFALSGRDTKLPRFNKNEQSMQRTALEEEAVRKANMADIELYAYAMELLQTTATACNIRTI